MGQLIQPNRLKETDAAARQLYGAGVAVVASLVNLRVGNVGNSPYVASFRFRATQNSSVNKLYLYMELVPPGYSSGGGGQIRMRIYEDDGTSNHFPNVSSIVYSEGSYTITESDVSSGRAIKQFNLRAIHNLTRDKLYHVVFDNLNTSANTFGSLNTAQIQKQYGKPTRWNLDSEFGACFSTSGVRGNWVNLTTTGSGNKLCCPIMNVGYSNGKWSGYTPFESGAVITRSFLVTKDAPIRETLRPTLNRRICGLSIRLACAVAGGLRVTVMRGAGAQTMAEAVINSTATNFSTEPLGKSSIINGHWYDIQFPNDIFFQAGQTYHVVIQSTDSSQWRVAPQRNGKVRGYPLAFTDGQCEIRRNGQWVTFNIHNHNGTQSPNDTNLPLVLHVVAP